MPFLHWFGAVFLIVQGSSSTRYLLDNGVEIVNSIDLPWNNEVYAMEPDKRDPGFIIMSDHVKMRIMSIDGNTKRLIAGSNIGYREGVGEASNFSVMASFVQLNESIIVVADLKNHCLRSIDRETLNTAPFSGRCEASGYQNGGSLTDARYSEPCGLALSGKKLFVVDSNNNAIRIVDLVSRVVSTLLRDDGRLIKPRYILLGSAEFMLVSLKDNGIVNVSTSGALTPLTSQQPGYKDGPLNSATFRELKGMSWMDPNVAVVSDFGNNRIRIVDLSEGKVSTLCRRPSRDGSESDCTFQGVVSVLVENVTIFVSGSSSVKHYDLLRTGDLLSSSLVTAPVSGGVSSQSDFLPGVISGVVVFLAAVVIAIGVTVWWRKKKSSKRASVPPADKSSAKNPNLGRPLPKPAEEDYATIDEFGMIASEKAYLQPRNEQTSSYTAESGTYSYASHPNNSRIGSQTEIQPIVNLKRTNADSNAVAGIPPAPNKQPQYVDSALAPILAVGKYVDMVPSVNESVQEKSHYVDILSLTPENTESTSNTASNDGAVNNENDVDLY